jgi:tetratricopeptide (TPR) repeat protein
VIFDRLRDWVVQAVQEELAQRRAKLDQRLLIEEEVIIYVNILAELHRHQGNYTLAEPLYMECLDTRKIILGVDHPDTLASMNNLAILYMNQSQCTLAEPMLVECVEKRKTFLGVAHPDTLGSLNNLAILYNIQGDYKLAEALLAESLEKCSVILGDNHPTTLLLTNNRLQTQQRNVGFESGFVFHYFSGRYYDKGYVARSSDPSPQVYSKSTIDLNYAAYSMGVFNNFYSQRISSSQEFSFSELKSYIQSLIESMNSPAINKEYADHLIGALMKALGVLRDVQMITVPTHLLTHSTTHSLTHSGRRFPTLFSS